jgi:hypothetical protein
MKVTLTDQDASLCHLAALIKYIKADGVLGRTPRYNAKLDFHGRIAEFSQSIAAELAVSRALAYPYDAFKDTYKTLADVGENLEIRWTDYNDGHLIVYPTDRITDIAILVTNHHPDYIIKGWMPVAVAKRDKYKKEGQDSWWVSQINLQPIDTLERSQYAHTIGSMSPMQ